MTVDLRRHAGLDTLRLVALGLVVLAHVIVVARAPWPAAIVGLDFGQLGVAVFCVLAGFLALGGDRPIGRWAAERFWRLLPAYWLVTIALFLANAFVGYKSASLSLFVAQMLGVGYFTHGGGNLLNVPSWFISLILACYVLAACVRLARRRRLVIATLALATVVAVIADFRVDFSRQVLAFVAGMGMREVPGLWRPLAIRSTLVVALPWVALLSPDFGYAAWAAAALALFSGLALPRRAFVAAASDYTYEVFLVHGPVIVLLVRLARLPVAASVLLGILAVIGAAVVLRLVTRTLTDVARRSPAASPATAPPAATAFPSSRMRALSVAVLVTFLVGLRSAGDTPVGGLTELPSAPPPGPNLLENAGFETAPAAGRLTGWAVKLDGNQWSLDAGRAGGVGLKLSDARAHSFTPPAEQATNLEPGLYTIEGRVKTANLGERVKGSGVRICLDGRPRINWWQCTDIARGTTDWTSLRQPSIPVRERGPYRVTLDAYARPDGTAWFDDVSLTRQATAPIEAYLLYPNFRGMLFDDRPTTVRVALFAAGRGRIRLSLIDEAGEVVERREYPVTPNAIVGELDAARVRRGQYLLRAELIGDSGRPVHAAPDYRIVKVPAAARKGFNVWFDEHNVTYLRGKPAFVLGLYNTTGYSTVRSTYADGEGGWGNDRIAQAPINMMINYWLGAAPIPALETYMDDLAAHGIYYLQTVNFYYRDHPLYQKLPYPAAKEGDAAVNRWVAKTLGAHRGLAGFYTADERPAEMIPKVFRQHRELAASAPGTVTYAVLGDGWEDQAPLWRDAADVLGLDPYPIRKPPGQNHLAMVGEWTRLGQEAVKGSRPLWMVIQYFPLTSQGGWPSYDDLRSMSWMAIIEGAKGLFYWSFGEKGLAWVKDAKAREQHWMDLVRVTREIKILEPALLAPDAALVARESSEGAIRWLGKRTPDGARYLFAYNSTGAEKAVTWTLAEPAREAVVLGTSSPGTKVDGARFADRFGPYETKRYLIR